MKKPKKSTNKEDDKHKLLVEALDHLFEAAKVLNTVADDDQRLQKQRMDFFSLQEVVWLAFEHIQGYAVGHTFDELKRATYFRYLRMVNLDAYLDEEGYQSGTFTFEKRDIDPNNLPWLMRPHTPPPN